MSDNESIVVISKILECKRKPNCDYNCSECSSNYTNEDMTEALSRAIDSLLERGKE